MKEWDIPDGLDDVAAALRLAKEGILVRRFRLQGVSVANL